MTDSRKLALPLLLLLLAVGASAVMRVRATALAAHGSPGGAEYRLDEASAHAVGARVLTASLRARAFTWDAGVTTQARVMLMTAVTHARPEARRLVDLIDGLATVRVGRPPAGAVGLTEARGDGRYVVTIDLDAVVGRFGQRGVDRDFLHELGHVVDQALLPDDLVRRLDAGIPRGYGCGQGVMGACADLRERFAESFAKWALDDIGVNLDLGYEILPPYPSLDAWGAPLARFAATVG